jgi:hypothetical protein
VIVPKIGCVPQALLEWARRAEVDAGARPGRNCQKHHYWIAANRFERRAKSHLAKDSELPQS